jgi:hypothetical protein
MEREIAESVAERAVRKSDRHWWCRCHS